MKQITKWQDELKDADLSLDALAQYLNLPAGSLDGGLAATRLFTLRAPKSYLSRIEKNNLNDPLLLELLPRFEETLDVPGYKADALNEKEYNPLPGLLHKYHGRVLVMATTHCAINCRFCFRRAFPYQDNQISPQAWQNILNYIQSDTSISEVILSGGDPLSAPDKLIARRYQELEKIAHVTTIRFHTRFPVFIPSRITEGLLNIFTSSRLKTVMIFHINHPNALKDDLLKEKLLELRAAKVILLNQSVLLKNINNSVQTLIDLSFSLFDNGILPYYLHQMDPVAGAAHFDVPVEESRKIVKGLSERLPGYLVPKWVQEIPGKLSKVAVV